MNGWLFREKNLFARGSFGFIMQIVRMANDLLVV
jgi:hypothetical protein